MSIDIGAVKLHLNQIRTYETQLHQAKNSLREYQSTIHANWQGDEVQFISKAIDSVLTDINRVIDQLEYIYADINNMVGQLSDEKDC